MSSGTVDVLAVKDEIRKYKARLQEVERDNKALSAELTSLTERNSIIQTQQRILTCMEEIRFHEDSSEIEVFDKKFREANAKLEISILNEEIRAALPKLEAEAAKHEQQIKLYSRKLKDQDAEMALIPEQYLVDSQRISAQVAVLKKKRDDLQCEFIFIDLGCEVMCICLFFTVKLDRKAKLIQQEESNLKSTNDKLRVEVISNSMLIGYMFSSLVCLLRSPVCLKSSFIQRLKDNAQNTFSSRKRPESHISHPR